MPLKVFNSRSYTNKTFLFSKLNMAIRRHQTSPRCWPLVSHFKHTPCWRRLCLTALWANITSSTKPEVRITYCVDEVGGLSQLQQLTCTENFVKFGRVILEISERTDTVTDRQTDLQTYADMLFAILRWEVKNAGTRYRNLINFTKYNANKNVLILPNIQKYCMS